MESLQKSTQHKPVALISFLSCSKLKFSKNINIQTTMTRKQTMKTALFLLLLISGQTGVHAQTRYRFDPRFKFSYDWGVNKMKPNSLSFDFIAGLHTSEQSSIGLGIGYSSHSHLVP